MQQTRLVEAAHALKLSYNPTLRLVLTGKLKGEQRDGRWYVDAKSLAAMQRERELAKEQSPVPTA